MGLSEGIAGQVAATREPVLVVGIFDWDHYEDEEHRPASAICVPLIAKNDLVLSEGVGITAVRSACPAVGVPDYTGDITVFRDPASRLASNVDVTAALTDVESTCAEETAVRRPAARRVRKGDSWTRSRRA